MISVILLSVCITLAISVAVRRLLPRIPNWLIISFVVIVPPLFYVAYSIYQALVEIGKYEAMYGAVPPDIVSGFSVSANEALLKGAVWAILALAVSFFTLRDLDRRAGK